MREGDERTCARCGKQPRTDGGRFGREWLCFDCYAREHQRHRQWDNGARVYHVHCWLCYEAHAQRYDLDREGELSTTACQQGFRSYSLSGTGGTGWLGICGVFFEKQTDGNGWQ